MNLLTFTTASRLLAALVFLWAASAGAQDCRKLSPSPSGSSLISDLFGDDSAGISGACQVAAGDDFYSVRIEYHGFTDKPYRLVGQLLDAGRRKVPGSEAVSISLDSGAGSADLTFHFDPRESASTEPYVPVSYLKVSVGEADDPLADLDFGGLSLTGTSAEYRLDHRFRVGASGGGTSSVTVSVAFTPVKRAATIKQ